MTKTFKKQAAQGDMILIKIDELPSGLKKDKAVNGEYVVTHSETGHNHVVSEKDCTLYHANDNEFKAYLVVDNTTTLRHLRGFDTHAPIELKKGIYEIRRQREYTPEGFRRAQD